MTKIPLAVLTLAMMTSAASAQSRTFYDASGKVVGRSSTDSAGTVTNYDSRGRVISREFTSGNTMRAVAFWADDDDDLSAKNHLRRTARIRRPRCAGLLPRSTSIAKVPIGENGSLSGTSDSRFSCNSALSALALAFRLRNYLNGKLLWVAMSQSNHEFGGISTDLKLSLVGEYLHQFTTALRPQFENLWYIDAFAGTGERTVIIPGRAADMLGPEVDARVERRAGSAKIAIDVSPAFDRLVFMDKRPKHIAALNDLRTANPSRNISVVPGDANAEIMKLLGEQKSWAGTRAVMFLDPYGMSVDWRTLEAIRRTEAIDVWYLVSLSGLFRQATRDAEDLDASKRAALTRMIGTPDWEKDWYEMSQRINLFGDTDERLARTAEVDDMEKYFGARLAGLFASVLPPLRLNDDRGIPQFALFFAISNPKTAAIGLASRIARHILKSGISSKVRP